MCVCVGRPALISAFCLVSFVLLPDTRPLHQAGNTAIWKHVGCCWKWRNPMIWSFGSIVPSTVAHGQHIGCWHWNIIFAFGVCSLIYSLVIIPHNTPDTLSVHEKRIWNSLFYCLVIRKLFALNTLSSFQLKNLHSSLSITIVWVTHNAICTNVLPYNAEFEMRFVHYFLFLHGEV